MTDSKSPGDDGKEAPYFPLPRKREEPSPYRKAGPAAPDVAEPVKPVKEPVVVSRPEPPVPVVPVVPVVKPQKAPKPPKPLSREDIEALRPSDPEPPWNKMMARYPRLFGVGLFLLATWLFKSAVLSDRETYLAAAVGDKVYVHPAMYFRGTAGAAAFGLWLVIWAIPLDEKTDRPREWWILGLFIVIVLAIAARDVAADLVVRLFA